jgi:copper chaperone CopZ
MNFETIKLNIKGMTCPSCSASVERLVDTLEGLESRTISHETDSGEFTFDPNILDESTLIAKINEGHYKVDNAYAPSFTFEAVVPACPKCGNRGQLVPNTVFRSNVKGDSFKNINTEIDNYICMDSDCDVAYYNDENKEVILKDELKRELWYKKGTKRVIACYCNNIDTEQVKDAIVNHNLTKWDDVMGLYRAKVIEKCETLNPTGYCCRSTFDGMVKEIKTELIGASK